MRCLVLLLLVGMAYALPSEEYQKRYWDKISPEDQQRSECGPRAVEVFNGYALDYTHCGLKCQEAYGHTFVGVRHAGIQFLTSIPPRVDCICCIQEHTDKEM